MQHLLPVLKQMSKASLGNYFLAFYSGTNFKHLSAKSSSIHFLCISHPFLHSEFQQKLLSVSVCSRYVCPGSLYSQKDKGRDYNYFEPGIKFKILYWGKEDKVREENNERVLVSSGGASFRAPPAALLQLWGFLWTLQQSRVLNASKINSYTLNMSELILAIGEKPNSEHPLHSPTALSTWPRKARVRIR